MERSSNVCELCETPLEIVLDDGRKMTFTAHSEDYCRAATSGRLRMLEASLRRHVLEETAFHRELIATHERERKLRDVMEDIAEETQDAAIKIAIAEALRGPPPKDEDRRRAAVDKLEVTRAARDIGYDPHHSQGVEVSELLATRSPLEYRCPACHAPIGHACVVDIAAGSRLATSFHKEREDEARVR